MKKNTFRLAYFLFFALAALPTVSPIPAGAVWSDLGLYGGQVYSIALDKNNTSKMFAGAYYGGGLFRTTDGGTGWTPVTTGAEGTGFDGEATFSNTAVWGVEIAPSDSNVVWAVHNYWAEKSTDGGNIWTHIPNSTMQSSQFRWCKSVAIDPAYPSIVYVGAGGPNSSHLNGAIYKTTDGGSTWAKSGISGSFNVGNGLYTATLDHEFYGTVVDIAVHPTNSNIIWALDFNDVTGNYVGFLYLSTDGGQTWSWKVALQAYIGEQGLAVKQNEPNVVFIATFYGIAKVMWPKDGAGNVLWNNSPTVTYPIGWASGKNIRAIAFSPSDPNTLYYAGFDSKLGKSTNGGSSFTQYEAGRQFITLAPHPTNSNAIFGGERLLGVYKGIYDSGTANYAWTAVNNGINAIQVNDIAVDPNDKTHLLVGTQAGIYEKIGNGNWTSTAPLTYTEAFSVAFDPSDTDGSTYYAGIESMLARTTDHGASWSYSNNLGYPHYISDVKVDPNDSTKLFITTRDPGAVYKSVDRGANLSAVTPSSVSFDFNAVAIDPNNSNNIFAGGGTYSEAGVLGKLYKSTNGGTNWSVVLDNVIVNAMLIDPADSNVIYAGCGYSGGTDIPLYKSTTGGEVWQKSYQGIPGSPSRYGIWGASATNIYMLRHTGSIPKGGTDDSYMIRYNGSSFTKEEIGISKPLYGIWGSDASNIFAVGESGTVARYSGSAWASSQLGSFDLHGVWGSSGTNVFAVGTGGTICYFNGISWSFSISPTGEDLHGIWGSSYTNIYAVGSSGVILHYDGSWSQMTSPAAERLEDAWGSSSSNIFAVGSPRLVGSTRYYTILRWNGSSWSVMSTSSVPAGKSGILRSVWGSSGSDVFAVGDDGVVLRYNGSDWTAMSSGTTDPLYGVWGAASNNVYAVGMFGTIIQYNGTSWSALETSGNIPGEKTGLWNAVTALAFSPEGHIYAATNRQGVYASANKAKSWINMSAPPYTINAVVAGSVISGGSAGTYSLSGEGLLFGYVSDVNMGTGLYDARVNSNIPGGPSTTTEADGSWAMMHPAGIFNVIASKLGYPPKTEFNVPIYDGSWTYVTLGLNRDVTPPAISIGNPSPVFTRSGPVTYVVTYTGADTVTLANANVTLNKTGTADGTIAVSGTGNTTRTVTISGITGNGTLGISIAAGTASDLAGNRAAASGPSATFTVDSAAAGDIDGSGVVDLKDAILALQVMSSQTLPPGITIHLGADVNGDGKIGMAEAIYILQKIAHLRN